MCTGTPFIVETISPQAGHRSSRPAPNLLSYRGSSYKQCHCKCYIYFCLTLYVTNTRKHSTVFYTFELYFNTIFAFTHIFYLTHNLFLDNGSKCQLVRSKLHCVTCEFDYSMFIWEAFRCTTRQIFILRGKTVSQLYASKLSRASSFIRLIHDSGNAGAIYPYLSAKVFENCTMHHAQYLLDGLSEFGKISHCG